MARGNTHRHNHGTDAPFPQYKIGTIVVWDGRYAFVTAIDAGEYGERLTFKLWDTGAIITTTPGLDPRFEGTV